MWILWRSLGFVAECVKHFDTVKLVTNPPARQSFHDQCGQITGATVRPTWGQPQTPDFLGMTPVDQVRLILAMTTSTLLS